MQFMPATWRSYGRGGDIQDPRDAILAAGRFLAAAGAARSEAGALYRYNPSQLLRDRRLPLRADHPPRPARLRRAVRRRRAARLSPQG